MSSLNTTEMKLKSTPTGGVSGEHSPYYRRLLSAGYKGFIQGSLGGAGFYGLLGTAVGALIAIPVALFTPLGWTAALSLIPAAAGLGVVKGSTTFGNIGTVAAISAESADLAEQRRYLLDRYYDLPDGPEGDRQAEIIKQELTKMQHTNQPHPLFHWKTVAICAAIGGLLALAIAVPAAAGFAAAFEHTALQTALHALEAGIGETAFTSVVIAIGTAFGALAGATIGIDRHYVRKWFDGSEKILHTESHNAGGIDERAMQVERIREAAKIDHETQRIMERRRVLNTYDNQIPSELTATVPEPKTPIASLDAPDTKISAATLQNRLADIQQAMNIPTV